MDRPDLRLVEGAEAGMPVATIGEAWEEEQAEAQNGLLASQVSLLECLASGSATSPALIAACRVAKARYAERQAQRAGPLLRSAGGLEVSARFEGPTRGRGVNPLTAKEGSAGFKGLEVLQVQPFVVEPLTGKESEREREREGVSGELRLEFRTV